jgi:hypothetical protein
MYRFASHTLAATRLDVSFNTKSGMTILQGSTALHVDADGRLLPLWISVLCMYVCRYVCMYVCMYVCLCVYMYDSYVCINVCIYACVHVCIMRMYVSMYMCECVCLYDPYVYINVYIMHSHFTVPMYYIYIYTYISYLHTHTHTYLQTNRHYKKKTPHT